MEEPVRIRIQGLVQQQRRKRVVFVVVAFMLAISATLALTKLGPNQTHAAVTYTIDTGSDNWPADGECIIDCSLRDALGLAASGDSVIFDASIAGSTISFVPGSGSMVVPNGVTIDATGRNISVNSFIVNDAFTISDNATIRGFANITGTVDAITTVGEANPSNNLIENNGLTASSMAVNMQTTVGTGSGNIIRGNTMNSTTTNINLNVAGGQLIDNEIRNNTFGSATNMDVGVFGSNGNIIEGNTFASPGSSMNINGGRSNRIGPGNDIRGYVALFNATETVIDGNNAANGGGFTNGGFMTIGVFPIGSANIVVSNNDFLTSGTFGIDISQTNDVTLINNTFASCSNALQLQESMGIRIVNSTFSGSVGADIRNMDTTKPFEVVAYNSAFQSATTVPATDFTQTNHSFVSYRHNRQDGAIRMQGTMNWNSGTLALRHDSPTYTGQSVSQMFNAAAVSGITINDATGVGATEAWILTYRSASNDWAVEGTVSGVQAAPAQSGAMYATPTAMNFTLVQNAPNDGDRAIITALAQSSDFIKQKTLSVAPVDAALNGGRSSLTFNAGGTLEMLGVDGANSAIQSADGASYYDLIINQGRFVGEYFTLDHLNGGLDIQNASTIERLREGDFRNSAPGGPHIHFRDVRNNAPLMPYMNNTFDATPTFDIAAENNTHVVFCNSTRGVGADTVQAGSSVTWCTQPTITDLAVVQRQDGSRIADLSFTAADPGSDLVTVSTLEYSADGGNTWHNVTSDLRGHTAQAHAAGSVFSGVWELDRDLANTETDALRVRVQVDDAGIVSNLLERQGITVDTLPPRNFANFNVLRTAETNIVWTWSAVTENHFDEYLIRYGTTAGGPYASTWSQANDATMRFRSNTETTMTGLSKNTTYYATIAARDEYGNAVTLAEQSGRTGAALRPTIIVSIFSDVNGDGVRNASENALENVRALLYRDNGDGAYTSVDQLLESRVSNSLGRVQFSTSALGTYFVRVNVPTGFTLTTGNALAKFVFTKEETQSHVVGLQGEEGFTLDLQSQKASIEANGADEAIITATLLERNGTPTTTPTTVNFTTTKGTLSRSVTQTVDGRSTTSLTSTEEGIIDVAARAGNTAATIQIFAGPKVGQPTLSPTPPLAGTPVSPTPTPTEKVSGATVRSTVASALQFLKDNLPLIEITAGALALLGIMAVLPLASMASLPLALWNIFSNALTIIGWKKKPKKWGVVYDSLTKKPVQLAAVRLMETTSKRIISTQITDKNGRFGFIAPSGDYLITVAKSGFRFPSTFVTTAIDGRFQNVYHGKSLFVTEERAADMNVNVPLDPLLATEKPKLLTLKKGTYHAVAVLQRLNIYILFIGLLLSLAITLVEPSTLSVVFIGVYTILLVLKIAVIGRYEKAWGVAFDGMSGETLPGTIIQIYDAPSKTLKETMITDVLGRFKFLPKPGTYTLRAVKAGYLFPGNAVKKRYRNVYRSNEAITIVKEHQAIVDKNLPLSPEESSIQRNGEQTLPTAHLPGMQT